MKNYCHYALLLLLGLWLMLLPRQLQAQYRGYQIDKQTSYVKVPFDRINNYIVVDVTMNRIFPMRFIVDTGARYTILTDKAYAEIAGLDLGRTIYLVGADRKRKLPAYLTHGVQLALPGVTAYKQSILVLEQDYFDFEKHLGHDIDGIIGIDLFRRFVVEINYDKRIMTLRVPKSIKPSFYRKYHKLPTEIDEGKVYVNLPIELRPKTYIDTRLLVDTGSSLALILNTNPQDTLLLPRKVIRGTIGKGLGGTLEGYIGKVVQVDMEPYGFNGVLTSFLQQEDSTMIDEIQALPYREGILGATLLSRCNIIVDIPNTQAVYIKSNRAYKKPLRYDRSGMVIVAAGPYLKTYVVDNVLEDSPADKAGIQAGDIIRRVGRWPASWYTLSGITRRFTGDIGKTISVTLQRGAYRIEADVTLQELF